MWRSLSYHERQCINDEFSNVLALIKQQFLDPCKNPKDYCTSFCKNSKILGNHINSNKMLQELVLQINHPTHVAEKGLKLVPFCFAGHETLNFIQIIKQGTISLTNSSKSYVFCKSSYQRITDLGVCTTIDFKEVRVLVLYDNLESFKIKFLLHSLSKMVYFLFTFY